ncbi:MAG: uroporphyrinogen-III C-methyltransferase [Pseudohongiellaceae bacterium]
MAEQAETAKVLDEIAQKNTAKPRGKASVKAKKQTVSSGLFIALVMSVVVLSALAFVAYQQRLLAGQLTSLKSENQRLEQVLANQALDNETSAERIEQVILEQSQPLESDNTALLEVQAELSGELTRLQQQIQSLQSTQQTAVASPDFEWKIYEAEYLLGIADQKIQLESDVVAAIAMMESADAALLASGSSRVFALRQAIANELTRLRATEFFDRQGVYLQIGSLIQEVESISIANSMRQNFENGAASAASAAVDGSESQDMFNASLDFLKTVFVWRRWEDTPGAILSPEQGEFIRQNLKLLLEQSQLALLMKDQAVFSESLNKSREWLDRYAVVDSNAAEVIKASLEELALINVDPILPGITESLSLARQLTAAGQ